MSQINPRKATPRNGTDSPGPDSAAIPVARHPLPQHPHTHFPAHLRGNRGGRPMNKPSSPAVEESPEIKALREKHGLLLPGLKDMFPNWSDEDILTVLGEANGNVEVAALRISDGKAEQWSVSSKKDKKDRLPSSSIPRDIPSRDGAASPGRGGFRGGRGGYAGARGGRGGARGVSGSGAPTPPIGAKEGPGWGKVPLTNGMKGEWPATHSDAPAQIGDVALEINGWAIAAANVNEAAAGDAGKAAAGASITPATLTSTKASTAKAPSKPVQQEPPKMSWAQIAKPKPKPALPPPAAAAEPTATEKKEEVTEPAAEAREAAHDLVVEPFDAPVLEPTHEAQESWPAHEEEAQTAPQDDWIAVTPPQQVAVDLPQEEPQSQPVEAPAPEVHVEEPAPAPKITESEPAVAQIPSPIHPPGLSPAASAPTPALSSSGTTQTATPSTVSKPLTPRLAHRASAKYKTSDVPVVMPGGGLPSSTLGSLSFGNAINGMDASPVGSRFGMQFGSLSLNDDMDAPLEPPAPVAEPEKPAVPSPEKVEAPAPVVSQVPTVPVPAPVHHEPSPHVPTQALANLNQQHLDQPPALPIQQQRSGPGLSAINNLFQQAAQQQQVPQQPTPVQTQPIQHPSSLPHQVTASSTIPTQPLSATTPLSSLPFGTPGLHHLAPQQQTQQAAHQQPPPLQTQASHLGQSQLNQQVPGIGSSGGLGSGQQHLPYSSLGQPQQSSQLPPHLGAGLGQDLSQPQHPAIAAQNAYFRGSQDVASSPYGAAFHAPTPPQQASHLDHSNSYGGFGSQLGTGQQQPQLGQQQQASHLGGSFGASPSTNDYAGYDSQNRGFYDSYNQGSGFQSRNQLGHDDSSKSTLPISNLAGSLPGQQAASSQTGNQTGVSGQQAGQFGMMPYYYQQPFFHPLQTHQYNPYATPQNPYAKYGPPYNQPPSVPTAPAAGQQGGNKPPVAAAAASPYGSQSHLHYPNQNSPYDDPSAGGYQSSTGAGNDYAKQQLYGQGMSNFYGSQNLGGAQNGPQLGNAGQGQRSAGAASSPDNAYKPYNGPGVGGADKQGQQQGQQGRGVTTGQGAGGQPQQGNFYPNRYSNQAQPTAQGYPQSDGQFYPSYQQQPRQYWS